MLYSIPEHRRRGSSTEEEEALAFLEGCFGDENFTINDAAEALIDGELTTDYSRAQQMVSQLASKGYLNNE